MVIEFTFSKDGSSHNGDDLLAEDIANHYCADAIWNGDWCNRIRSFKKEDDQ